MLQLEGECQTRAGADAATARANLAPSKGAVKCKSSAPLIPFKCDGGGTKRVFFLSAISLRNTIYSVAMFCGLCVILKLHDIILSECVLSINLQVKAQYSFSFKLVSLNAVLCIECHRNSLADSVCLVGIIYGRLKVFIREYFRLYPLKLQFIREGIIKISE